MPIFAPKTGNLSRRRLSLESLELREMMSVSALDMPPISYEPAESAYFADQGNTAQVFAAESVPQTFSTLATSVVYLAPPKAAKPAYEATPSTITVHWTDPVATSTLTTTGITGFDIVVRNTKTKAIVKEATVGVSDRSFTVEGLEPQIRYEFTITSVGGADVSTTRAALKMSVSTAKFPVITGKATNLTMTAADIVITDTDKIIPFADGKTVKTYKIEYVEKVTSTPNWAGASSVTIAAGSTVLDTKKGTISATIDGLKPATQYFFRVVTTYTDGSSVTTPLTAEGRQVTFKTVALPATTIAKSFYSLTSSNDFAVGLSGKLTNYNKLPAGTNVSFSLLVSNLSTTVKGTGLLTNPQEISGSTFTGITPVKTTGEFSMNAVSFESITAALGSSTMLGTKTLTLQLVVTFDFPDGVTAITYSKVGKLTLPSWYTVA
jgi:hypothetical protein